MKPDDKTTMAELRKSPFYVAVARESFECYPGVGARHVFKHIVSDTLWARNVYSSDDDSHEAACWYAVRAVQTTRYEEIR